MPFSGPSDKSLPSNVKKLGSKERRRWVTVFNSSFSRCQSKGGSDCEAVAFRNANGVLKNASTTFAGLMGGKEALGRALVEFSAADPPDTINLFPAPGSFTHPVWGKFEVTEEGNKEFVKNFNAHVYQEQVAIDAEHESKLSGAVGYIQELSLNDDGGVEAAVEWTPRGEKLIKDDSFKYISPEWFEQWTDPASEEEFANVVIGAALTTRPFFKGLRSLVAREGHLYDVEDGAGSVPVVRSAIEGISYNDLQNMIMSAARHEFPAIFGGGDHGYVVDLFDDFAIINGHDYSTYWRIDYGYGKDNAITFSDNPVEVQRRTIWEDAPHGEGSHGAADHGKEDAQDSKKKRSKNRRKENKMAKVDELEKEVEGLEEPERQSLFSKLASALGATVKFGHDADEVEEEEEEEEEKKENEDSNDDEEEEESSDDDSKTATEVAGLRSQLKSSEDARKASDQRLGVLETSARTARYRDIILGRDEGGQRQAKESGVALHPMVGELKDKMTILESLDEDSDAFKAYVASEREHANALHEAGTFGEIGQDSHGEGVSGSAVAQFNAKIVTLRAADKKLSEEDAIEKVAEDEPKLYDAYDREKSGRKASYPTS